MANEARIFAGLQILVGHEQYRSLPQSFQADVSTAKGPTPGAISVPLAGVAVDLSALTLPGLCRIANLDTTNYIEYGIYDPETVRFYPIGEVKAGEFYVFCFSRNFSTEYGSGTGTAGPETNQFYVKAYGGACNIIVEVFET